MFKHSNFRKNWKKVPRDKENEELQSEQNIVDCKNVCSLYIFLVFFYKIHYCCGGVCTGCLSASYAFEIIYFPIIYSVLQTLLLMGVKTSWRLAGLTDIQTIWHAVTAAVAREMCSWGRHPTLAICWSSITPWGSNTSYLECH